jgi:hypothetical protein
MTAMDWQREGSANGEAVGRSGICLKAVLSQEVSQCSASVAEEPIDCGGTAPSQRGGAAVASHRIVSLATAQFTQFVTS